MTWSPSSLFDDAAAWVQSLPKQSKSGREPASSAEKLKIYALYKQATLGPCTSKRPGMISQVERHKHAAYSGLGAMSVEDAKIAYVQIIAIKTLCENQMAEGRAHNEMLLASEAPPAFLAALLGSDDAQPKWEGTIPEQWQEFAAQVHRVTELCKTTNQDAAQLTGLFNQAFFGDNFLEKPSMLGGLAGGVSSSLVAITKDEWNTWEKVKGTAREAAMEAYCAKAKTLPLK